MNGPTMRRFTCGSARRTAKWPTSTLRGTTTRSMASAARASPGAGSLPGKKLMVLASSTVWAIPLLDVERLGSGGLAGGVERDLPDPRLRLPQQLLAAAFERLAALIDGDRFLERHLALLEPLDDRLEFLDRPLERQALDVGMIGLGHDRGPLSRSI